MCPARLTTLPADQVHKTYMENHPLVIVEPVRMTAGELQPRTGIAEPLKAGDP